MDHLIKDDSPARQDSNFAQIIWERLNDYDQLDYGFNLLTSPTNLATQLIVSLQGLIAHDIYAAGIFERLTLAEIDEPQRMRLLQAFSDSARELVNASTHEKLNFVEKVTRLIKSEAEEELMKTREARIAIAITEAFEKKCLQVKDRDITEIPFLPQMAGNRPHLIATTPQPK